MLVMGGDRTAAGDAPLQSATVSWQRTTRVDGDSVLATLDVFALGVTDLRSFQLGLDFGNSPSNGVELVSVFVNQERTDFVFSGLEPLLRVDPSGQRLYAGLIDSTVGSQRDVYLGPFVLRVDRRVADSLTVDLSPNARTILTDSASRPMVLDVDVPQN